MSDGGKGSAPRKQRDDEAFKRNWQTIFRKKDEPECFGQNDCTSLIYSMCAYKTECHKKAEKDN